MENKAVNTFSDIVENILVRLSLIEELLTTEDIKWMKHKQQQTY